MTPTGVTRFPNPPATSTINGVHLYDILDPDDLAAALADGFVREQTHPTEPLSILNYTEKAAYDSVWNPVTLACRGLIYRTDTGQVAARPYRKFFNYGQDGAPDLDLNAPAVVTDKQDGSLGILYPLPSGGWAVATRGSFASDQAIHATEVLNSRYADYEPPQGWTVLVEIVYPENRIVCDYGDLDDLVLLGAVDIATGRTYEPDAVTCWPGPRTQTFEYASLAEALAADPRPNAEGFVVHLTDTDERVKIKQADYVELHRIVTNLTARRIHDWLLDGGSLADFIAPLPDEFHDWCRQVAAGITAAVDAQADRLHTAFHDVRAQMPDGWVLSDRTSRATFAKVAAQHPDKWALFALLDGKDIRPELLKRARPEPYLTPTGRTYGEDTA